MSNYLKISTMDTANGTGIGVVLWMSGCSHHCKGCQNPTTWDETAGEPISDLVIENLLAKLGSDHVGRFTLSGGDPLEPCNIETSTSIAKVVRTQYPNKKIWIYTGNLWENLKNLPIMRYVDYLVDGEYQQDKRNLKLNFRGSENQRIIDVQKSLKTQTLQLANF